ncbi:MAG: response regulator [Treponema sp.]|nr:response regulator [Treponema sp.]
MKKRILIVEDNIALSHIQKDWLEREGYSVATAMNEPFAHKLLRKEQFDLILSDVRLPHFCRCCFWNYDINSCGNESIWNFGSTFCKSIVFSSS